jgi:thiol:disulfide interchange protein DsbD
VDWFNQFETMAQNQPFLALLVAFAGGVVAGFTPCAYPMLPIIVAFTGSKARGSRLRGLILSVFYVFGVAVVYAALGAFAAISGQMFGALTASPYVYLFVGNVCLLFGLVMLEAIPLPTPAFLCRLRVRDLPCHDVITSILMGGVSALVISSCTTPILGVLLALVATHQKVFWGTAMLFVFAYGMGSLVILAGTFSGLLASLPRSGMWMRNVQRAFAALMILAGEYFLIKTGELWL